MRWSTCCRPTTLTSGRWTEPNHVLTTHVVVASQTDRDALAQVRRDVVQFCKEYRFAHTTGEIE